MNRLLKIMIAEDEVFADEFLTIVLNDIAKDILHAKNGEEAINLCKANPDIDLILMDIKMPKINGLSATKEIRKFNKNVIIIAQTAYALAGDDIIAIETGCNDYIPKPIDKEKLLNKVNSYFNNK